MRVLARLYSVVLTAVAGVLVSAAFVSAAAIEVKVKEGIGSYLVDQNGATLYVFKKDAPDKSVCGAGNGCIDKWPAFFVDKPDLGDNLKAADVGVITREDGKRQITYKGMPLYFFFKDVKAGDTNGQGVNNVWFVAVP